MADCEIHFCLHKTSQITTKYQAVNVGTSRWRREKFSQVSQRLGSRILEYLVIQGA